MPELPEVETIKRSLEPLILGQRIVASELLLAKALKLAGPDQLSAATSQAVISELLRRGKHLIIRLDTGYDLIFHLRMTGKLLFEPQEAELPKHTTAVFYFASQTKLVFADTRKFGTLHLVTSGDWERVSSLKGIGPEPLGADFTFDYFYAGLQRRTKIKPLLLDQTFIAGLGNIYADESLFRAGIHPERPAASLSKAEAERLYRAVRETIADGVEHRGTTVSDYLDGLGKKGTFQNLLAVYRRTGEVCPRCGRTIERIVVGGRSSHLCPGCQVKSDCD
ncbi:MAG: bifunctional DNA-formamidopyrimidine glycosylase/DNA-(apurinic or apyrimidinic site) lyase [Firmicutes bacterium]|nr:bifunctional DNA-formamidopyrimidine glycosylase/DNA-(apurinic or apyrimidinic site) lyase [Bacillota bacterium]